MNPATVPLFVSALLALAACSKLEPGPAAEAATPVVEAPAEAATAAAKNDPAVINFEGFGPAKFGAGEEQVRMSWGRPLVAGRPAKGATCYQLYMDPKPEDGNGILFMFEDGKFVRYDVDLSLQVAPGDLTVGASAADVLSAFPGRVEDQPHKYVERGRNLVVSPTDGGPARLVFEISPAGVVNAWRIGLAPQVHYVEGCN